MLKHLVFIHNGNESSLNNLTDCNVKMTSDGIYELTARGYIEDDVIDDINKGTLVKIPEKELYDLGYDRGFHYFEIKQFKADDVLKEFELHAFSYIEPMKYIYDFEPPRPKPPVEPKEVYGYVTAATMLNVRDRPNDSGDIIAGIPRGMFVRGLPIRSWIQIQIDGKVGYIHSDFVSEEKPKDRPTTWETEAELEKMIQQRTDWLETSKKQRSIDIATADKYRRDKKKVPKALEDKIKKWTKEIIRYQTEIDELNTKLNGPYYRQIPNLKLNEKGNSKKDNQAAREQRRKELSNAEVKLASLKKELRSIESAENLRKVGYISAKKAANVRNKPNGKIVGQLKRGTKVDGILAYEWLEIPWGNGKAYVHIDMVQNNPPKKPGDKKPQKEIDEDKESATKQVLIKRYRRQIKTLEAEIYVLKDLIAQENGPTHKLEDFRKEQDKWDPTTHKGVRGDVILNDVLNYIGSDWRIVNHIDNIPGFDYIATNKKFGEIIDEIRTMLNCWVHYDHYLKDIHLFMPGEREDSMEYYMSVRNLDGLIRQEPEEDTFTHLLVKGKDGLTISTINNGDSWVIDEESYELLGYRVDRVWEDDRFEKPKDLLEMANQLIEENRASRDVYIVSVNNLLGIETGYMIGDTIHIGVSDEGYNSYIAEIQKDLINPELSKIQLGGTVSKSLVGDRLMSKFGNKAFGMSAGAKGHLKAGVGAYKQEFGKDILQDAKDEFNIRWEKDMATIENKLTDYYNHFDTEMKNREEAVRGYIDDEIAIINTQMEVWKGDIDSNLNNYYEHFDKEIKDVPGVTLDWLNNNVGVLNGETLMINSIKSKHIVAGEIKTEHLEAGAITSSKIYSNAILARHIRAGEIETGHLSAGAVTADNIMANSIKAKHMMAGEIFSIKLTSDSVTTALLEADKAKIDEILAKTIIADQMTAGVINGNNIMIDLNIGRTTTQASKTDRYKTDMFGGKYEIADGSTVAMRISGAGGYEFYPTSSNRGGMFYSNWSLNSNYNDVIHMSHYGNTTASIGYGTGSTTHPYILFDRNNRFNYSRSFESAEIHFRQTPKMHYGAIVNGTLYVGNDTSSTKMTLLETSNGFSIGQASGGRILFTGTEVYAGKGGNYERIYPRPAAEK